VLNDKTKDPTSKKGSPEKGCKKGEDSAKAKTKKTRGMRKKNPGVNN